MNETKDKLARTSLLPVCWLCTLIHPLRFPSMFATISVSLVPHNFRKEKHCALVFWIANRVSPSHTWYHDAKDSLVLSNLNRSQLSFPLPISPHHVLFDVPQRSLPSQEFPVPPKKTSSKRTIKGL